MTDTVPDAGPDTVPVSTVGLPDDLARLAGAHGVATWYGSWRHGRVEVSTATVVAVLAAMGVDASTPRAVAAALADAEQRPWRRILPPVVVVTDEQRTSVRVHMPHGSAVGVRIELEGGGDRRLDQEEHGVPPRPVDGALVGEASFVLPAGLPLGWHELVADVAQTGERASAPLVVTPARLALPAQLGAAGQRWGFMAQLYSVRSQRSWGLGDLADLTELLDWSGRELGADFLLVNPLQAAEPVGHMSPSPYLPSSRRFTNPVYIRVEDVPEAVHLRPGDRATVERSADELRATNTDAATLDRDRVWAAKRAALELVHAVPRTGARQAALDAYRAREGAGLGAFALWCALTEHFGPGVPWPAHVHDPDHRSTVALRRRLAGRTGFYEWLQWVADEQLAAAQAAARRAGMALGVVHDLAVGVHPQGADSWTLRDVLATGVSVGAPPDDFNQQGQDWSQPPWRPDALAEAGYRPFRDLVRTVLRHAGGLRVDHILGLFRLWWVPQGQLPLAGTYVQYDHHALVGILALEAHRAGAVVIGEDLGVVEPWVRDHLRERGVLGTSVLWFERDADQRPLPPTAWRELCLATVTTHDLPPTAGYLAQEHVDLRDRLGLLTQPVEVERREDAAAQARVLEGLRSLGLLGEDPSERDVVTALHQFLTLTPSRLVGVSLADAVGERRTQNQPGTFEEYPNWEVPLADGLGRAVLVEDLHTRPRVIALARLFAGAGPS